MAVAPFLNLKDDETELSKENIAALLSTYHLFTLYLIQYPKLSFYDVFCLSKRVKEKDESNYREIIRNSSYYSEYDYMIQIAKFFILNKFFSYHVDSNLYKMNTIDNISIPDYYFTSDSRKYNAKETMKFIRNAFNHNDKDNFQLFRLIQKENNPRLYIEIYLRVPNFHIVINIDELFDIIKPELNISSAYSYVFYDVHENPIISYQDYLNNKGKSMSYKIIHAFDFDKPTTSNIVFHQPEYSIFQKKISFTNEQIRAIDNQFELIGKSSNNALNDIVISRIMRDVIPFGMTKIEGYLFDLNYFLKALYNYESSYNDFCQDINSKIAFSNTDKMYQSIENFFYLKNNKGIVDRSFSLLISYILDSVLNEIDTLTIDDNTIPKDNLRNSFVHGTFYNYFNSNTKKEKFIIYDYLHKNKRGRTDDNLILDNPTINSYDIDSLMGFINNKIYSEKYSCPLDFIMNLQKFNGFKIVLKDNYTRFYINASFAPKIPFLLGIKDVNGIVCYMDDNDFKKISEHMKKIDFSKRGLNSDLVTYLKKIPSLSQKATKLFIKLSNNGTLSNETFYTVFSEIINELCELCKKYPSLSQIIIHSNDSDNTIKNR